MPASTLHRQRFRRRLLRRFAIYFVLPIVTLLTVRLIWGYEASHRLAATMAKLRAQGIPLTPEDFPDADAVPRGQNAIYDLKDAIDVFSPTSAEQELVSPSEGTGSLSSRRRTPQDLDAIEALWSSNSKIGELIDGAEIRPTAIVPRGDIRLLINYSITSSPIDFGRCRFLANFLIDMAVVAHARHNDVEAIRDVERVVVLSRLVDKYPSLICHLISLATYAVAAQALEDFEPSLDIRSPSTAAEAAHLLSYLQDDAVRVEGFRNAAEGEMAAYVMNYSTILNRQSWWIKPYGNDDLARLLVFSAAALPATGTVSWSQYKRPAPDWLFNPDRSYLDSAATAISGMLMPDYERPTQLFMVSISESRAVAILLASRLYAAKNGSLPRQESALVPEFLVRVPLDPFSADDAPLHYRIDADGPTVWSVGFNGTDEGGPVLFDEDGNKLRRYSFGPNDVDHSPDIVYGAALRSAVPPPPTNKQ